MVYFGGKRESFTRFILVHSKIATATASGTCPASYKRLDYLADLGIDAVWLSPIFPSPMVDFGYDVADYTDIHPLFGSMVDFERLLQKAHDRGIKIILDLVPNHTSSEHAWFQESRSSRDNPKRDWYIWRDPAPDGGPPNNWLSFFGGPAWTLDDTTGQYYLHQFVREQPELNYRHPQVLPAMLDNMRFWLDMGVDGFRVDVIWLMLKDEALRDEPPNPEWDGVDPHGSLHHIYTQNVPGVHELIQAMRALLDEYDERMMVGEIYLPNEDLVLYYGRDADECHLPYNFQLIHTPWEAKVVREAVDAYEASLPPGAWPNWVMGNHDQHRLATRIGREQARVAAMLLLTLRGTPTTYYGEEIGMVNVPIPAELVQDPPAVLQPEIADVIGRDPVRTPMQWDELDYAGFTSSTAGPWLPVAGDYRDVNVARQKKDPYSLFNLYRLLAHLRRAEAALHAGSYTSLESGHEDVFAFMRRYKTADAFLVVLNFGEEHCEIALSEQVSGRATIAIASNMDRAGRIELSSFNVAPDEGLILRLTE